VVMGLGYVGRSVASLAMAAGHEVTGFDPDSRRIESLGGSRKLMATTDPSALARADMLLVCVPTPIDQAGHPDRTAVLTAAAMIREYATETVRACLESTVDPDFAASGFAEAAGLGLDQVAHAPERVNPGPDEVDPRFVRRLVGGCTAVATAWAAAFYRSLGLEIYETTAEQAALAKLLENTQRLLNIALIGEFAAVCRARGVDVDAVVDAAATKPYGFQDYRARAGAGGHCVPVDPAWLVETGRRAGVELTTVNAALTANAHRAHELASALMHDAPDACHILVLGAAYKPDVVDTRESPTLRVAAALEAGGRIVRVCDPLTGGLPPYPVSELDSEALAWADAVLIVTLHQCLPLECLRDYPGPIYDASGDLGARLPGVGKRL
ncbi:MAG: nucleotide sugar dehydrogenase, partial [Nannocystaceae bacterium]